MRTLFTLLSLSMIVSCNTTNSPERAADKQSSELASSVSIVVLGTVQDAGSPHIACQKDCCKQLFENSDKSRKVVSLGVVDVINKKKFLFEATPDMPEQLKMLKEYANFESAETPDGIFLTHAHIGHYTGLMYFGKEAMNADSVPVHVMPRMKAFLEQNGPWSQLVSTNNIALNELSNGRAEVLTSNVQVVPFVVPHRDEYSETVGFKIIGPNKSALFIPDIDKWQKWEKDVITQIANVDYAFIDATFYDDEEINNRDMSEIPHPFIIESMSLFEKLSIEEKNKIHFIHFNHTNPILDIQNDKVKEVENKGFKIARLNRVFGL